MVNKCALTNSASGYTKGFKKPSFWSSRPDVFLGKYVFWKYAANLPENAHAGVQFQ